MEDLWAAGIHAQCGYPCARKHERTQIAFFLLLLLSGFARGRPCLRCLMCVKQQEAFFSCTESAWVVCAGVNGFMLDVCGDLRIVPLFFPDLNAYRHSLLP